MKKSLFLALFCLFVIYCLFVYLFGLLWTIMSCWCIKWTVPPLILSPLLRFFCLSKSQTTQRLAEVAHTERGMARVVEVVVFGRGRGKRDFPPPLLYRMEDIFLHILDGEHHSILRLFSLAPLAAGDSSKKQHFLNSPKTPTPEVSSPFLPPYTLHIRPEFRRLDAL